MKRLRQSSQSRDPRSTYDRGYVTESKLYFTVRLQTVYRRCRRWVRDQSLRDRRPRGQRQRSFERTNVLKESPRQEGIVLGRRPRPRTAVGPGSTGPPCWSLESPPLRPPLRGEGSAVRRRERGDEDEGRTDRDLSSSTHPKSSDLVKEVGGTTSVNRPLFTRSSRPISKQ